MVDVLCLKFYITVELGRYTVGREPLGKQRKHPATCDLPKVSRS